MSYTLFVLKKNGERVTKGSQVVTLGFSSNAILLQLFQAKL